LNGQTAYEMENRAGANTSSTSVKTNFLIYHPTGDKHEIYIFDGQRPSLQHECAILGLFFKLVSVAAGVDRLGTVFNQKNKVI